MLSQTVFHDCKDCFVLRVVYWVCVKFECCVYVAVGYYAPSLVGTQGAGCVGVAAAAGWLAEMCWGGRPGLAITLPGVSDH